MSEDFKKLKKNKNKLADKIREEAKKQDQTGGNKDERFWKPTVDKGNNGSAVIRFLPAPKGEEIPYVRVFSHFFKGPNGWYVENSLTTLGKDDPVSAYNSKLWNSGDDDSPERKQARRQKRRLEYISNIYVVKDSGNPENEGKVFLFKYGKKIFDQLKDAMNPEFDDQESINPFDLWEGATFNLRIRDVEGYRNYDKSKFEEAGPLLDDDEELEKIWKSEYPLQAFLADDQFKTYSELKARLSRVLGEKIDVSEHEEDDDDDKKTEAAPEEKSSDAEESEESDRKETKSKVSVKDDDDDDDEDLEFFKKLADE